MKYIERIHFSRPISEYLKEQLDRSIHHVLDVLDATVKGKEERDKLRKVILDQFNNYHRHASYVCTRVQEIVDGQANSN